MILSFISYFLFKHAIHVINKYRTFNVWHFVFNLGFNVFGIIKKGYTQLLL